MKTILLAALLVLAAASLRAENLRAPHPFPARQEPAVSDSVANRALDRMLAEFKQDPDALDLPYDSWTFTAHRYAGYAIVAATLTQVVLGAIAWDDRKAEREPDTKTAHKVIGYSTAGLSLFQTGLGIAGYLKLKDKESGETKRIVHLGLSCLATAGFVAAAAIAHDARRDIEDGTAASEGKTFDDLYSTHRAVGFLSAASVALTVAVIVW